MIRTATPNDAPLVAPLIYQAMPEVLTKLIGTDNKKEGILFLERLFTQEKNQYSYQNTLIYEKNNEILGSLVYYNGALIDMLSQSVFDFVKKEYGRTIT